MEKPEEGRQVYDKSRGVCLKLPGIRILLTGPWSVVALVILLALTVGVLYLVIAKSGPGLWLSGGLWLLFIVYWSTVAKNTAPPRQLNRWAVVEGRLQTVRRRTSESIICCEFDRITILSNLRLPPAACW